MKAVLNKDIEGLILNNINFVHYIVQNSFHLRPNNQDYDDCFQEGCMGLIEAANRFDPNLGYSFSTYSYSMIWGHVSSYLRQNKGVIRFPRKVLDLRYKIFKYQTDNPYNTIDDLLRDLNITINDYNDCTCDVLYLEDTVKGIKDDGDIITIGDTIPDPEDDVYLMLELDEIYTDIDTILDNIKYPRSKHHDLKSLFVEYIYDLIYEEKRAWNYYCTKYGISQPYFCRVVNKLMLELRSKIDNLRIEEVK